MDDQLELARRAHAADRTDVEAARRLQVELERAGRRDEVLDRFAFELACDQRWEDLERHHVFATTSIRHCLRCARDVHAVYTVDELAAAAVAGRCVRVVLDKVDHALATRRAVGHFLLDGHGAGAPAEEFTFAEQPRAAGRRLPCVVLSDPPPSSFRGFDQGIGRMGRVVRRAPKGTS